jgi:DNA invertase Pin-like site-specific DNA recombinase
MLAVFAEFERDILRDRVKAGIAQARKEGRPHGRPPSVTKYIQQVRALGKKGSQQKRDFTSPAYQPNLCAPIPRKLS